MTPSQCFATAIDVAEFRSAFFVEVPDISDTELVEVMNCAPHLLALARTWGWNETQVRDDFAAALEKRGFFVSG